MRLILFLSLCFSFNLCLAQEYLEWITGPTIDLGDVSYRKGKTAAFEFKNIGTDTLTIETVRTTCSCTAVDWQKEPIAPQESTTLKIEFKPNSEGTIRKTIKLFFYEKKKAVKMKLNGEVIWP